MKQASISSRLSNTGHHLASGHHPSMQCHVNTKSCVDCQEIHGGRSLDAMHDLGVIDCVKFHAVFPPVTNPGTRCGKYVGSGVTGKKLNRSRDTGSSRMEDHQKLKASIKHLISWFDEASKGLREIEARQERPGNEARDLTQRLQVVRSKREDARKSLNGAKYKDENALKNKKTSMQKLDKLHAITQERTNMLLELNEELETLESRLEELASMDATSDTELGKQKEQVKALMRKLTELHQAYPAIYSECEKELGIFILTPFK